MHKLLESRLIRNPRQHPQHLQRGLSGLRDQLMSGPVERTSWQVAMRSFPPRLIAFGNPGGIDLTGHYSKDDSRAYLAVPRMWTRDVAFRDAGLWPVGDAGVITRYIDKLLVEINQSLYGGRGLPKMEAIQAGVVGGVPVHAEVPTSGLDPASAERLRAAARQGTVSLGREVQSMLQSRGGASPGADTTKGSTAPRTELAGRALQAASTAAADVIAVATSTGLTNADIANQVLQSLSTGMLAVAPSIPFGIGYAVAGVLQIAAWVTTTWDHGLEAAEFAGYSYHWDPMHYRNVLRNRVLVQTCAEQASLDKIKAWPVGTGGVAGDDCKHWLIETSYGLVDGDNWTQRKSDHAIAGAIACARYLGDPLNDARMIGQIGTYLRYVGASEKVITMVDHWLWDSRRIERINEGRNTGEISFESKAYPDAEKIGKYPDYWRDWAYEGNGMTPGLFTRAHLTALHTRIRRQIVVIPHSTIAAPLALRFTASQTASMRKSLPRAASRSGAGATGLSSLLLPLGLGVGALLLIAAARK